ncbi:MAG: hypothetical protein JW908_14375 [Anaerolineales bacterium]|nr:hypothetical protein [Anaerolineales bacterium]
MSDKKEPVGMLVDLDRCTGCYSCQTACRETHHYGYDETWMQVVRRDPVLVDGKLRLYHLLAPSLDKCAICVEAGTEPLCTKVCMGKCLFVAPVSKLLPLLESKNALLLTQKKEG